MKKEENNQEMLNTPEQKHKKQKNQRHNGKKNKWIIQFGCQNHSETKRGEKIFIN